MSMNPAWNPRPPGLFGPVQLIPMNAKQHFAASYFVATNGKDTAEGSSAKPLAMFTNECTATVPAHGVELIRVQVKP